MQCLVAVKWQITKERVRERYRNSHLVLDTYTRQGQKRKRMHISMMNVANVEKPSPNRKGNDKYREKKQKQNKNNQFDRISVQLHIYGYGTSIKIYPNKNGYVISA